jgi:hypothetical protein
MHLRVEGLSRLTLHVAFITSAFVMQVGDRLLTIGDPGSATEWEPYANKTILIDAVNGRIILSYAGLGHIKEVPTDLWLVEAITRESPGPVLRAGAGPPPRGLRFCRPLGLTVGGVCKAVVRAIETDFLREPWYARKSGIEILITGWTWRRRVRFGLGRPRTFCTVITHNGRYGMPCKLYSELPSRWYENPAPRTRGWAHATIGAAPPPVREQFQRLKSRLSQPGQTATADDMETFIAAEIRRAAAHPAGDIIGTELMSVVVSPFAAPRIRFLRDTSLARPNLAYSPAYVHTSGMIAYPMQITGGGFVLESGSGENAQRVEFECVPPLPSNSVYAASSQQRRKLRN